jgi:hypothetical protein
MKPKAPSLPAENATSSDIFTPHDDPKQKRIEEHDVEITPGLSDPRTLNGPEILQPPPLGLPQPTKEKMDEVGTIQTDDERT